jgi:hypothetical protein
MALMDGLRPLRTDHGTDSREVDVPIIPCHDLDPVDDFTALIIGKAPESTATSVAITYLNVVCLEPPRRLRCCFCHSFSLPFLELVPRT